MADNDPPGVARLLREAADRLEGSRPSFAADRLEGSRPSLTSSQVEVAGLFDAYAARQGSQRRPRPRFLPPAPSPRRTRYTHTFVCLSDHLTDRVPDKFDKLELLTAGLGEKRLSFQGAENDPVGFRNEIEAAYPELRETGGFELLRIAGTTRSRDLSILQSPQEGYTTRFLRNPANGVGQATVFIRPLQRSIPLQTPAQTTPPQAGPLTRCLYCEEMFPFNSMKLHVQRCTRTNSGEVIVIDPDVPGPSRPRSPLDSRGDSTSVLPLSPCNLPGPSPNLPPSDQLNQPASPSNLQAMSSQYMAAPTRVPSQPPSSAQADLCVSRSHLEVPAAPPMSVSPLPGCSSSPNLPLPSTSTLPGTSQSPCNLSDLPVSPHSLQFVKDLFSPEWKMEPDFHRAAELYSESLLADNVRGGVVVLRLDLRDGQEEQDASLNATYKASKANWAGPVNCVLEGDRAFGEGVTRWFFSRTIGLLQHGCHMRVGNMAVATLFEGEPGHLTPSNSDSLIQNDMFVIAGRIIGHSFLHGGPCVAGISQAIVHRLFGGTPVTATVVLQDCADIDYRCTIQLLEGEAVLSEDEVARINNLCEKLDVDYYTPSNRRWLYEWLLIGAVLRRAQRQIRQLKQGLQHTMVWTLFSERPDTIPLLFPRDYGGPSSESLLESISWPVLNEDDDDDYDEACSLDDTCRVAGYLRTYIENASSAELKELLKFWTGWEVLSLGAELTVEVVGAAPGSLPKASTCFQTIKLPSHYTEYIEFVHGVRASVSSTDTGFGLA